MKRALVVGSNGWVASRLVELLQKDCPGIYVRGFDIASRREGSTVQDFVRGDISKAEDVEKAMDSIDTVFHVAALVNGSAELLHKVNVDGVKNVISACQKFGVERLIYTSSASVVYNGVPIIQGNEDLPYCQKGLDPYNETKSIAESLILNSNGTTSNKNTLQTCAIRPHSIYGPGDPISWPQMISNAKAGKFKWKMTEDVHESSYTFIDNLCHCEILAAKKLQEKNSKAGGKAYNVSDGEDGLLWSKLYDVAELSGVPRSQFGKMSLIPIFPIIYQIAWFFWYIGYPLGTFTPYVLSLVTTTHTYDIGRARKELGYEPVESQKLEKTTTHTYDIGRARKELGYEPVESPKLSWQKTVKSFQNYKVKEVPSKSKLPIVLLLAVCVAGIAWFKFF